MKPFLQNKIWKKVKGNKLIYLSFVFMLALAMFVPTHQIMAQVDPLLVGSAAGALAGAASTVSHSFVDIAFGSVQQIIMSTFEVLILPLAAAILALSGIILDTAIQFSLHTAYIFSLSPAINLGWSIIRDVCNLFFIFLLIYISIGTIIKGGGFETKKLLTHVIVAALLINFSLFATKVVIDVSNIFGNWLYGGITKTLAVNTIPGSNGSVSLSSLITTRLGILNFWSNATANAADQKTTTDKLTDPSKSFIGVILRLMVVLVATYIFAYCAILFISRSVTLLFLLVFSPIGFMGSVLPKLKEHAKEWKDELINAAVFPISFLLMLYIALQFINSLGVLNIDALQDKTISLSSIGMTISISQYFQYFLIIFILHSCLKTAKDSSGRMGKLFTKLAEGLGKTLVGVAGGGAALLGKVAIGGAAARLAGNAKLNQMVAGGGISGAIAGAAKSRLGTVADFHFDPRAIAGIDIKGGKGYTGMMKDIGERQEKAQKEIGAKSGEIKAAKSELALAEENAYAQHKDLGKGYKEALKTFDDARKAGRTTKQDRDEYDNAQKELNKIKSAISNDGEFGIQKKILEEQEVILKKMVDAGESKEKISAMEAAMRQGLAARAAEGGIGVKIAETMTKPFTEQTKQASESILGAATVLAGAAAQITTLGLGRLSARQYAGDNKKVAGKLRDIAGEGEKKKQQENISKILSELAGGDGGNTPPAAPATPPTPPKTT